MIGKHYSLEHYNCAHFVADYYRDKLNIDIPVTDEFGLSFLRWMRKHFKETNKPNDHDLVYMKTNNSTHIGVYCGYGVYHNYKVGNSKGSVVHWTLGAIQRNYGKVTFWQWSQ